VRNKVLGAIGAGLATIALAAGPASAATQTSVQGNGASVTQTRGVLNVAVVNQSNQSQQLMGWRNRARQLNRQRALIGFGLRR